MFDPVYIVWAVIPVALGAVCFHAVGRYYSRDGGGREYPGDTFKHFLFCVVTFGIAVFIDISIFPSLAPHLKFEYAEPEMFRWLIYPALLTLFAKILHFRDKKGEAEEKEERRKRRAKYGSLR